MPDPTGAVVRSGPVRYATAARFAPPRPVDAGDTRPPSGEICPQLPSRLDAVMGAPLDPRPQGEDCLHLTVTTPARDDGARPVLVWFHGGGFSSGAGLMDWYDGGALAAEGDVVVVGVNYRLGALGYLCLDGISEGNLGLYDQLEALRWVGEHIAAYGETPATSRSSASPRAPSPSGCCWRRVRRGGSCTGRSSRARPCPSRPAPARTPRTSAASSPACWARTRAPLLFPRSWRRNGRPRGSTCGAPAAPWNRPSSRSSGPPSRRTTRSPPRPSAVWTSCTAGTRTT